MERYGEMQRRTAETDVNVSFAIDGEGEAHVQTGIGFLDHMLYLLARHGLFDIQVTCRGDLDVDAHHSVEDIGICLGQALRQALGDKAGIRRYGSFMLPMDEALAQVIIDVSGRPYCRFEAEFAGQACGTFDVQLTEEFFRTLAMEARLTLHMKVYYGINDHHMIEALFKAFARALDMATQMDGRFSGIPSTKGVL